MNACFFSWVLPWYPRWRSDLVATLCQALITILMELKGGFENKTFCHTYMQYTHSLIPIHFAVFLYNREYFFSFRSPISVDVKFFERFHQLFFCVGHSVRFLFTWQERISLKFLWLRSNQQESQTSSSPGSVGFALSILPAHCQYMTGKGTCSCSVG